MIKNTFNKFKNYFKARREFKKEYKDFYSSIPEKYKDRLEIKNIIFILAILLSFFSGFRFSFIIASYDNNSSSSSIIVDNTKHEVFKNEDGTYTGQTYIFGGEDSEDDYDLIGNTAYVSFKADQVEVSTNVLNVDDNNIIQSGNDTDCFYNLSLSDLINVFDTLFNYIALDTNKAYFVCCYDYSEYMRLAWLIDYNNASTLNLKVVRYNAQTGAYIGNYKCLDFTNSSYNVSSSGNSYLKYFFGYNSVINSYSSLVFNNVTFSVGSINDTIFSAFYKSFYTGGIIEEVNFKSYLVVEYVVDYFKLYTVVGGGVNSSTIYKYDYSFSFYYDWIEDEYDRYERDDSTKIVLTGSEEYTLFSWYDTFSITLNTTFNTSSSGITPGFRLKFEDIYDGNANPYILSFDYYASSFVPTSNTSLSSQLTPSCYFEFVNNGGDLLTAFYSSGGSTNANAYTAGYDEGYKFGYKDGNTIGEANGYEKGYKDANGNPIGDMIFAIADVPFKILKDFIGFNIMGFDVLQFVTGILGLLMAIFILKMFI